MRSISSGIILVLLALQLAHSATVRDKYNDLAAEERHVTEFGSNAERVRSKRQEDNSEIFSDGTDTSLNIHPLPLTISDDTKQNSDENNDEDYVSLNSNRDAEDIDDGKTVENKIVKEEPKMMEMNKEIDVSSGSTDISDSEEIESQTDSKEIVVEQAVESEESKPDEKLDVGESVDNLMDQTTDINESGVDESGKVEHIDEGTKSDENVKLEEKTISEVGDVASAIKVEEDSKLVETNADLKMANPDVYLENENASESEEYENSEQDEYSTEKSIRTLVSDPVATSELLEQDREEPIDDVEVLPKYIKTTEASSERDIKVEFENGEGSGDSDVTASSENGSGLEDLDGSHAFTNMSVNAQDKNVLVPNPVKTITENDPLHLDDNLFTDNDDDEPPIEVPVENSSEQITIVHSVFVDEEDDQDTDDENPISDPTTTVSESRDIDADTLEKESDSEGTEDANNMKGDELLIVPDMTTTVKNTEGSASGGINLDDSEDSYDDSDEVPAVLNQGVITVQPAQSSHETKEDPDQSADVADSITELSVTGEEVPDSDDSIGAIEEPIVAVNVNKLNTIPDENIVGGKTHMNISTNDKLDETDAVSADVERDEDVSKIPESINEIGVKTDDKAASEAESDDTSISSGSFIILGAIMVAIILLLGYTVLKSRRQKKRQRDARKAKEDDPGTELKLITPHQNGNGPSNGIAEAERLLSSNGDYDDTKSAAGTQNKCVNGDITAGMDQTIRVNLSPKMANGKSVMSANDQSGQVNNQPMEDPRTDAVAVDLRYVPDAAPPSATTDVMQSPSDSSCSLNSVDDRGSWVYGTTPLETTKIKMFIDEDSIPKTPIVIEKRGGVTVDV